MQMLASSRVCFRRGYKLKCLQGPDSDISDNVLGAMIMFQGLTGSW